MGRPGNEEIPKAATQLLSLLGLHGLVCSVCYGKGVNQGSQTKWDYRLPLLLAAFLSVCGFITLWALRENGNFDKVLVFVSTLLASITGFYFGGERSRRRSVDSGSQTKK
jgi:hypothetical protein